MLSDLSVPGVEVRTAHPPFLPKPCLHVASGTPDSRPASSAQLLWVSKPLPFCRLPLLSGPFGVRGLTVRTSLNARPTSEHPTRICTCCVQSEYPTSCPAFRLSGRLCSRPREADPEATLTQSPHLILSESCWLFLQTYPRLYLTYSDHPDPVVDFKTPLEMITKRDAKVKVGVKRHLGKLKRYTS